MLRCRQTHSLTSRPPPLPLQRHRALRTRVRRRVEAPNLLFQKLATPPQNTTKNQTRTWMAASKHQSLNCHTPKPLVKLNSRAGRTWEDSKHLLTKEEIEVTKEIEGTKEIKGEDGSKQLARSASDEFCSVHTNFRSSIPQSLISSLLFPRKTSIRPSTRKKKNSLRCQPEPTLRKS